jgi:SAM-dependent methyltransferase
MAAFFPSLNSSAMWDREYARGDWDRLDAESEIGRYALVLAHVCRLSARPVILDVGCGPGRLLRMLSRVDYEQYVGVDVSEEAVARARALELERSSFVVGFAEDFVTERRFDAIVFNEVMYYLRQPVDVAERYAAMLNEGGELIISMYECRPARSVWRRLEKRFDTLHAARVTNHLKHTWDVRVLKHRAA